MSWGVVNSVNSVGYVPQASAVPSLTGNEGVLDVSSSVPIEQTDSFIADASSEKKDNFSYIRDFTAKAELSGDSWLINSQDFLELKKIVSMYSYAFEEQSTPNELQEKINQKLEEKGYLAKARSLDTALAQEQKLKTQEQELQAQKQNEQAALTVYSAYTGGASKKEAHEALDPWLKQTGAEVVSLSQEESTKQIEQGKAENDQVFERAGAGDTQAQTEARERHANLVIANNDLESLPVTTQSDVTADLATVEGAIAADKLEITRAESQQNEQAEREIVAKDANEVKIAFKSSEQALESSDDDSEETKQKKTDLHNACDKLEHEKHGKHYSKEIINIATEGMTEEEKEAFLDRIHKHKATKEDEVQIKTATAKHDTNGDISRGFAALNEKGFSELFNGQSQLDWLRQNRERLNLDQVLHESTLRRIRTESYSSSSRYYAAPEDEKDSSGSGRSSSAAATAPTLSDPIHDKNVSMGLITDLNQTQKKIAQEYNLDPKTQMTLIELLATGDKQASLQYAKDHGMSALEASISSLQRNQPTKTAPPPSRNDNGWSAFALNNEADPFLERPLGHGMSLDDFFKVSIS